MEFLGYLLVLEILPIMLWIIGAICDNKASKFPNMSIGYKSKLSIKNKITWEYSNKVSAQVSGAMGTFLFIMNAIIMLNLGVESIKFIIISNLIAVVLVIFIVERILKKKFDLNGQIKNN